MYFENFQLRAGVFGVKRVWALFLLALLITGCDVSNAVFINPNSRSELDEDLEAVLEEASAGKGLNHFIMPGSTDLAAIPQDPNNPLSAAKVKLGKLLYHETGLGTNPKYPEGAQTYSCASCHHVAAGFQAGRIQGVGEGGMGFGVRGEGRVNDPHYEITALDIQPIRSPSAMNTAYQDVMLWNGQFGAVGTNAGTEANWTVGTPKEENILGYEGLEIQAIAALKVHRMDRIELSVASNHETYKTLFAEAFPGQPIDRVYAGLAIGAYERTLLANAAPFQRWLRGKKNAMTDQEKRGAVLFFGKAECATCHNGPALNSMTFYALGMADLEGPGVYGDVPVDKAESLGRGGFTGDPADNYKFKTPQIYNLLDSPFYGHGGTFNSVREVIEYKNNAVPTRSVTASQVPTAFKPLGLTSTEIDDITAFIEGALYDAELHRYLPASLPSGNCFPVNDVTARADLGCGS